MRNYSFVLCWSLGMEKKEEKGRKMPAGNNGVVSENYYNPLFH